MSKLTARQKGVLNRAQLQDYFAQYPDPISATALARVTGQHVNTIHAHCRNLINCGYLEEKLIRVNYSNSRNGDALANPLERDVIHYRRAFNRH
jgi:hypothetical protein